MPSGCIAEDSVNVFLFQLAQDRRQRSQALTGLWENMPDPANDLTAVFVDRVTAGAP